jgi:tetratricopeptide (TPR) repeat protein
LVALLFLAVATASAQKQEMPKMLLMDMDMMVQATRAVNDMYNFKFDKAETEFRWFQIKYPNHPLPYFLLGLSEWWKIVPNIDNQQYDTKFLAYMDTVINVSEQLYEANEKNIEAAFFLAAAYGFKGRLHSERKDWRKAAVASKNSLNYLDKSKGYEELSPEFLFGDALYNYYRDWVPENYPSLKTILWLFPKGDKAQGIKQLQEVANNAFYTRTEAQYFLMRIYSDENQPIKAYQLAKYLHETFPDNAYFERYFARLAFMQGRLEEVEQVSLNILDKLETKRLPGYEVTSGRYASYYLGYIYSNTQSDAEKAKTYYKRAVVYSEQGNAFDSGYYWGALAALGRIYDREENVPEARKYYEVLLERAERKSDHYKEAKQYLAKHKEKRRRRDRA